MHPNTKSTAESVRWGTFFPPALMRAYVLVVALILLPSFASASSGKTDANGCHTEKKTGNYHCHTQSSSSTATLKKAAPAAPKKAAVKTVVTKKAVSSSKASVSSVAKSESCTIKGNIAKDGEKIFHVDGCQSYGATKIDTSAGEKWFCSESEAVSAGWRKALNCP